jgi:DNA-binding NtrC family response regulator
VTAGEGPPLAILFVDDEPAILRSIARALQGTRFEVLSAASAADALALMRQRDVDVLVSDIDMPGMTGIELLAVARSEFPTTLRMLLTGAATMPRALAAINEGEVHRFLTKPFDLELFVATMTALAARIERLRREGELDAREAHREGFFRWVERAFPGTLAVARNERGEVVLDPPLEDLALIEGAPRARG